MLPNGNAHGVLLLNSDGMDVIVSPNALTYKVIGGVFDFYFFIGPTPDQVVEQYMEVIGTPHMPVYWALGFHQSKYGYPNIQYVEQVVANYSAANIPLDTICTWSTLLYSILPYSTLTCLLALSLSRTRTNTCTRNTGNDIDYMDQYLDFTFDPVNYPPSQVASFVQQLHQQGQQYVVILDPGIEINNTYASYTQLVSSGAYIIDAKGQPFVGHVWPPGNVIFPDFLHPQSQPWWQNQIKAFFQIVPVDGLWIDMNEISNFCTGECTSKRSPADSPRQLGAVRLIRSFIRSLVRSLTFNCLAASLDQSLEPAVRHQQRWLAPTSQHQDARHDGHALQWLARVRRAQPLWIDRVDCDQDCARESPPQRALVRAHALDLPELGPPRCALDRR